ncbi:hypothetical protein [Massilia sp. CT11-137]|uniref:hypothetical protein n=1 Tax=Massilia sp. CT11-137 TaxID=3393901 RepID=UPI0039A3FE8C
MDTAAGARRAPAAARTRGTGARAPAGGAARRCDHPAPRDRAGRTRRRAAGGRHARRREHARAPPASSAGAAMLERARRDVGAIDRALRKENNPYIVAPPDSPQIRLRRGIQAAADMAPNAWYQAPKVAELVNNTGDGARRERVISGGGTYCMTERAPTTSIDMIEKHGKWRQTNCPEHESTPSSQEWRTARD